MYEELGLAIVRKAVEDYINAKRNIKNRYHIERSIWVMHDVERFIRSEWFSIICDLDRDYILEKIQAA